MIGTRCGVDDRRERRSARVEGPSGAGPLALPAPASRAEYWQMATARTDRAIEELAEAPRYQLVVEALLEFAHCRDRHPGMSMISQRATQRQGVERPRGSPSGVRPRM